MTQRPIRVVALAAGFCAFFVVSSAPVERLSDASFAWHMAQHVVMLFVVPALVLLGRPLDVFRAVAGKTTFSRVVRATRPLHAIASAPVALLFFVAVLWATHFTGLYEAALERAGIHVAEHALYIAAGFLFWLPVLAPPPLRPIPYPARLLYLLVALPQGAFIGFVLATAHAPLYAHYASSMPLGAALEDQRDAAALMWIVGGVLLLGAFLGTLGAWAWHENRRSVVALTLMVLASAPSATTFARTPQGRALGSPSAALDRAWASAALDLRARKPSTHNQAATTRA